MSLPFPMKFSFWVFKSSFLFLLFFLAFTSCSSILNTLLDGSTAAHRNFTAISEFRTINRRELAECPGSNPYIEIKGITNSSMLSDEEFVTVKVSGVLNPSDGDWVAMISPSTADTASCIENGYLYWQTGDLSELPLLCHYPVKAAYLSNDPDYLTCKKKECKKYGQGKKKIECEVTTCSATLKFHVVNIRTDIEFVLFSGGFHNPCLLARSNTLRFANPKNPLYGHISSVDSTGTSMRLTWVSGDKQPQQAKYGNGKTVTSAVTSFSQDDMCTSILPSPAKDFGWHDPGYIHSVVMTGLKPSSEFSYRYGSYSVGWSEEIHFRTPPAGGSDEVKFLVYGDMGKAPLDSSVEHYIQPGSVSVIEAMSHEIDSNKADSIFHIGDISYATGFLVEWDFFLQLIKPVASRVSYMTAIGNHERDYIGSGSVYITPDSGGECGVAYETYFQMPTSEKDKPWYSIEQGSVHFTVFSTEHDFAGEYEWMAKDMASVDRSKTPWLVVMGHRAMYSSCYGPISVNMTLVNALDPLLVENKVDVVLFGHVHNYERSCSMANKECKAMPIKDGNGIDTYNHGNYTAPVHATVGMAGFTLDKFPDNVESWSLQRISQFGYVRGHATKKELNFEFVNSKTRAVEDRFRIIKN